MGEPRRLDCELLNVETASMAVRPYHTLAAIRKWSNSRVMSWRGTDTSGD